MTVGPKTKKGNHDLYLSVGWRGRTGRIFHRLSVTGPVLVRMRDDGQKNLVIRLRNLSSKVQKVSGSLSVPSPLVASRRHVSMSLCALQDTTLTVALAGWNRVRVPLHVKVRLRVGDQSVSKSLMVYPHVPNGDFEDDTAGDRIPDWWTGWTRRGPCLGSKVFRLDPSRKAAGKYSLRVDPNPTEGNWSIAQPMCCRLKAHTRYKVSVDICRDEATPGVYAQITHLRFGQKGFKTGVWQHFEGEFWFGTETEMPLQNPGHDWIRWIRLVNRSRSTAWFDNLTIQEVP